MTGRSVCIAWALLLCTAMAQAGPHTISYQGSVIDPDNGRPLSDGAYLMRFSLYEDPTTGPAVWQQAQSVDVIRGLFSVQLDDEDTFPRLFNSLVEIWIGVEVDLDQSGTYEPSERFDPRQRLAGPVWRSHRIQPREGSPNIIGGLADNEATTDVFGAVIAGGGVIETVPPPAPSHFPNRVTDHFGTISGGSGNQAGYEDDNPFREDYATVGGGKINKAQGQLSTIGGGFDNAIYGKHPSGFASTIAGGAHNDSGGSNTFIGGGQYNHTSGSMSTVGGGFRNKATGQYATVPGGIDNQAVGKASFAAGNNARARGTGCFVWSDSSTAAPFEFVASNGFAARASGGFWFYTAGDLQSGVAVGAGGNSWASLSDRNRKENFEQVDGREVLERLAAIPLSTWNYKSEDPSIRHMGPMAQDLHAAFGLGDSDTRIATIDADGVALAAIQGLHQVLRAKEEQIGEQQRRIEALAAGCEKQRRETDKLRARLAALEARVLGETQE